MVEGDLSSAYGMIMMRSPEREEQGEKRYFEDTYGVDLDKLIELYWAMVSDEPIEEVGVLSFLVAYELGRSHEQLIRDTPII